MWSNLEIVLCMFQKHLHPIVVEYSTESCWVKIFRFSIYFCVYPAWSSFNFVNVLINVFLKFQKSSAIISLNVFFHFPLSSSAIVTTCFSGCIILPHISLHFSSITVLCVLKLHGLDWSVSKSTDSFFCHLKSTTKSSIVNFSFLLFYFLIPEFLFGHFKNNIS